MQGWRISMEDAHTAVLNLLEDNPKAAKEHASKLSFFGVYDGHGGSNVALFAGDNIHRIVAKQDTFKTGNYEQALKDGFLATDRAILNGMPFPGSSRPTRRGCSQPPYPPHHWGGLVPLPAPRPPLLISTF
jgi:serine/threonine protein phosphatase PrpC